DPRRQRPLWPAGQRRSVENSWSTCQASGRGPIGGAKRNGGPEERVNVARAGTVIDDGRANGETTVHRGGGRCGDAGLVQIGDDLAVDLVRVLRTVAKANDIQRNRREQLQSRLLFDGLLQILGQRTSSGNHGAKLPGAVGLDGEPCLQRSKTTRQVGSKIAGPGRAGGQATGFAP